MKISNVLQLKDFSIMLGIGILIGLLYGVLNLLTLIRKNIIIQIVIDVIFSVVTLAVFVIFINIINMGQFRLFLLIGYIVGFFVERLTLGKLFAKGFKKVYNVLINIMKRFANSKLGRMIFK